MRWLTENIFSQKRRAPRITAPQLVVYYWNGGTPVGHCVRDFSNSGFYLLTEDRWHPGTLLLMMLQEKSEGRSIRVQSKVIRSGEDGVAFMFLFPSEGEGLAGGSDRKAVISFAESLRQSRT